MCMRKYWRYVGVVVGLMILDQVIKNWAYRRLQGKANFFILGRFLSLEFFPNQGIAFGISLPAWIFYLSFGVIITILVYLFFRYYQKKDLLPLFALTLVFGGAISNVIDRLRFGFVIDYLNFAFWPVFNLADLMVVAGVLILCVIVLRTPKH